MKKCTKCHIEKELSEFNKSSNAKDGHKPRCKGCSNEDTKHYYATHQEKERLRKIKYRSENPNKIKEINKKYRANNRDVMLEREAEYIKTHKEYQKNWQKENRLANNATKRRYYATNHGKNVFYALKLKRRAKKFGTDDGTVTSQFLKQLADNTKTCIFLGTELTAENRHLDHIVPLSRGGAHTVDNVRFISAKANLMKHNRLDSEFIPVLWGYLIEESKKEDLFKKYAS